MKTFAMIMITGFLLALTYQYFAFDEDQFIYQEMSKKTKIAIDNKKYKIPEDEESQIKIKTYLYKNILTRQFMESNPLEVVKEQELFMNKYQPFIVHVDDYNTQLLNVSEKKCEYNENHTYEIEMTQNRLAKDFCFSPENVDYFKNLEVAKFRLVTLKSASDIQNEAIKREFKVRLTEEIKQRAVAEFISEHRKFTFFL
ncbi:MAG: hypothetical protein AAGB12_07485 [Pseudomonadota bacterium]